MYYSWLEMKLEETNATSSFGESAVLAAKYEGINTTLDLSHSWERCPSFLFISTAIYTNAKLSIWNPCFWILRATSLLALAIKCLFR